MGATTVNINGRCEMESSNTGNTLVSFMLEMLHNKFLLLTVILAIGAAAYLGVGLVMLLGH